MKKLLTMGLIVVLSMFLSTTVVAQKESGRKGCEGHKKQEHVAKRKVETKKGCSKCSACAKCATLKKEIAGLKKRLEAATKGRRSRSERRPEGRRGHRGTRPDPKKKHRMDRMRKLFEMRKNRTV